MRVRVVGWIAVAAGAGLLWPLRRRFGWAGAIAALLLAALGGLLASGLLPSFPDPKRAIKDTAQALGPWSYLLVGALAFLETGAFVGLVVPGETVVIVGGVIAGQGEIDLLLLIGVVWLCAALGDTSSFFIGRRLGRTFVLRHGERLRITPDRLYQVERYFARHGGKTILIGRWIGLVRALAPFVAGSSGVPYSRFLPYSIIGTGLWSTTFCVLGFIFWHSFDQVAALASRATAAFGFVAAMVVAVVVSWRLLRDVERRARVVKALERAERKRGFGWAVRLLRRFWERRLVPFARWLAPQLRFLVDRLTPGALGLELTTPVAVAGAAAYVLTLESVTVARNPGPTTLDRAAADVAERLRDGTLLDVARYLTELGSTPVILGLLVFALVVLVAARRFYDAGAILLGALLLFVSVQALKYGIDRPRPNGALVAAEGPSFPSGHASYATAWIAVAVAFARALPGITRGATLVAAAVALTAIVGVTRIYLGVHYFSDVVAGWALGAFAFSVAAAVFVVLAHRRRRRVEGRSLTGSATILGDTSVYSDDASDIGRTARTSTPAGPNSGTSAAAGPISGANAPRGESQ